MSSAIVRNVVCSVISWSPTHHVDERCADAERRDRHHDDARPVQAEEHEHAEREVDEEHDADQDGHDEVDRLRRRRERVAREGHARLVEREGEDVVPLQREGGEPDHAREHPQQHQGRADRGRDRAAHGRRAGDGRRERGRRLERRALLGGGHATGSAANPRRPPASARTSMIGRSPSVMMVSPPPLRAW